MESRIEAFRAAATGRIGDCNSNCSFGRINSDESENCYYPRNALLPNRFLLYSSYMLVVLTTSFLPSRTFINTILSSFYLCFRLYVL